MRLLLVEDDELLVQALSHRLAAQRYAVDVALNGEEGWSFAQATTYDLIVLDVNLPKLSGLELCQRLRQVSYHQPILLLTAKSSCDDKVAGLDAGADDYVVKPCDIEELCARIRALLRRPQGTVTPLLEWGELRLDPSCCEVTYQGKFVSLSSKEYSLLELFLRHPQQFFSSSSVLDHLWRFEDSPSEETVRTLVKRLRQKLKLAGAEDIIETAYGQGYRLKSLTDRQFPPTNCPREAAVAAWAQFKEPMLEQLAIVEQAVALLQSNLLPREQREQARQAAHKLAGSLGMFGFSNGSQLGREIEHQLQLDNDNTGSIQLMRLVNQLHQELQVNPKVSTYFTTLSQVDTLPKYHKRWQQLVGVGADFAFIQALQKEGINYGLQIDLVQDINEARNRFSQQVPDAILLDLFSFDSPSAGLGLLEELATQYPYLPVLVFVTHDDLSDRLQIVQRSHCQLISRATPVHNILATVQEVLASRKLAETKVLAVDDDPLTLRTLQQALLTQGVQLFTLDNPQQFWQTFQAITPDLLILDVEMPNISGIELCQVVRSDHQWNRIPIVFLTAHQDVATIQQLFRAGGDDYLAKPFTELDIISCLCSRLSRSRQSIIGDG